MSGMFVAGLDRLDREGGKAPLGGPKRAWIPRVGRARIPSLNSRIGAVGDTHAYALSDAARIRLRAATSSLLLLRDSRSLLRGFAASRTIATTRRKRAPPTSRGTFPRPESLRRPGAGEMLSTPRDGRPHPCRPGFAGLRALPMAGPIDGRAQGYRPVQQVARSVDLDELHGGCRGRAGGMACGLAGRSPRFCPHLRLHTKSRSGGHPPS